MHIHIHTPHTAPLKIHQGLSAWALLTFGAGNTLIRDCPVHCGMLSSISGLHPLDASSPPVWTTRNISMHCSMAPAGMLISCREPLEYDNGRGIQMEWDTFPHLLILDLQAPYSTRQCLLTVGACTSSADPFPKHAAMKNLQPSYLMVKDKMLSSTRSGKDTKLPALTTSLQHCNGGSSQCNQIRQIKSLQTEGKKKKLKFYIHRQYYSLWRKYNETKQPLLDLINEFSRLQNTRSIHRYHFFLHTSNEQSKIEF